MEKRVIKKVIKNPLVAVARVWMKMSPWISSSELYLKVLYRLKTGHKLNLEHPVTFNEKMQWLKLHSTDPLYTTLADKYEVRKFVADRIGEEYLIPLIGVYDRLEDIDFEALPNQFVMKTTHDSGSIVICKDKTSFDIEKARKKITNSLKYEYYYKGREYPYKNIKHRIVVEQYMEDKETGELTDYKFFCFNGKPEMIFVASERFAGKGVVKFTYFDMDYNVLPIHSSGHDNSKTLAKPDCFDEMVKVLNKLCLDLPFIRIDLYAINHKVYFGEYTFFHDGGIVNLEPDEWNYKLGEKIHLPIDK